MNNAKIVQSDNFGMSGEMPGRDEKFLLWAMPFEDAMAICKILNSRVDNYGGVYFRVAPKDYKLKVFEP